MGHDCSILSIPASKYEVRWVMGITLVSIENLNVSWIVLCDDDTFFFYKNLMLLLSTFNPEEMHYIGGITEDQGHYDKIGHFSYGGGATFISKKLAKILQNELPKHIDHYSPILGGDEMLARIIHDIIHANFTVISSLHQMDLRGDISGMFEAGYINSDIVTLHHYDDRVIDFNSDVEESIFDGEFLTDLRLVWWSMGPHRTTQVSLDVLFNSYEVLGDIFLTRLAWNDPNANDRTLLLTLGYSLIEYSSNIPSHDFDKIERTWESAWYKDEVGRLVNFTDMETRTKKPKRQFLLESIQFDHESNSLDLIFSETIQGMEKRVKVYPK